MRQASQRLLRPVAEHWFGRGWCGHAMPVSPSSCDQLPLLTAREQSRFNRLTFPLQLRHSGRTMDRREFVASFAALGATAALPAVATAQTNPPSKATDDPAAALPDASRRLLRGGLVRVGQLRLTLFWHLERRLLLQMADAVPPELSRRARKRRSRTRYRRVLQRPLPVDRSPARARVLFPRPVQYRP